MLQIGTIESSTLVILKKLMTVPELKDFSLVGGTALALRFGHRKSIDLDLFASSEFDTDTIITALEKNFPSAYKHISTNSIGIFGYIEGVKIDLIKYHFYPLIAPIVEEEGIRFFSNEDLMAMKVNAILRRAVKKDFWDIAELLEHYTVEEMINNYTKKFSNQMLLISIPRALTYFDDAENSDDPVSLKGQDWIGIKTRIRDKINEFLQ
ncbi:MAG: nucleotidyl transferase AbiEii/AbiGii toxin family protein [Dysgonamonadaceae bacterium]|nr:nucleotidyl transferase AbiEii/AbiGii toxin family protein [Dysgonamonadaceae bacterium]